MLEITRRGLFWTPVYDGEPPPPVVDTISPEDASQRDCVVVLFASLKRHTFRPMADDDSAPFYLLLHTDHSIRLFPLPPAEAGELRGLMRDLVGRDEFDEKEYVSTVMGEREARRRVKVLATLAALNPNGEWIIDDNAELIKVMARLTASDGPQSIYDMERVYHSCRLNGAVTSEVISHLRHRWNEAKDETVRKKILDVVDRIFEPTIMRHGSPNFSTLSGWVKRLSQRVDVYTSPISSKVISSLEEKIGVFEKQAVMGIPINQFDDHFERLDDLEELRGRSSVRAQHL